MYLSFINVFSIICPLRKDQIKDQIIAYLATFLHLLHASAYLTMSCYTWKWICEKKEIEYVFLFITLASSIAKFHFIFNIQKVLVWMQETWVRSLDWEDPLEDAMSTHSSIPAWRISMNRGAWRVTVHGVTKSWTWLRDKACESVSAHLCPTLHSYEEQ